MQEMRDQSLGREDPLEKEMATSFNIYETLFSHLQNKKGQLYLLNGAILSITWDYTC